MRHAISIMGGRKAIRVIRDRGFDLDKVKVLAGASGAAKFLVLTGIDRVLMNRFEGRTDPLYLVGTSIGAFRMAAYCQRAPLEALGNLEREYIAQQYETRPTRRDITDESLRILNAFIEDDEIEHMLDHPFMRISFLSSKCKGLLKSENVLLQGFGIALAGGMNRLGRKALGRFFERALFCAPGEAPPFVTMDEFPLEMHRLSKSNFKAALLSSGSIPVSMEGVSNIPGVPGVFRDGGVLDYHLDIPFLPDEDGFVLYPHFYEKITPGWFDKSLNRRPKEKNVDNVVLVAPSRSFVDSLPFGRIPDRKDFRTFFGRDRERMDYWQKVVARNGEMGQEFHEAIESGRIREMIRPLECKRG